MRLSGERRGCAQRWPEARTPVDTQSASRKQFKSLRVDQRWQRKEGIDTAGGKLRDAGKRTVNAYRSTVSMMVVLLAVTIGVDSMGGVRVIVMNRCRVLMPCGSVGFALHGDMPQKRVCLRAHANAGQPVIAKHHYMAGRREGLNAHRQNG